jgi:hypothetical protein
MANNIFGSCAYQSQRAMLDAIVSHWLDGSGRIGAEERRELWAMTDEQLAAECIEGWRLDLPEEGWPAEEATLSHMGEEGYRASDLAAAFARERAAQMGGESV